MKYKSALLFLLLGLTTSISACSLIQAKNKNEEEASNATVYYLTRIYVDEADQYSSSHANEPTPTVLKFDYKKMKTYDLTADDVLGDYSPMYGYHESYVEKAKLTVAVEFEEDTVTQYYLEFTQDGKAKMQKQVDKATIVNNEGTIPNASSKEYSSPGILDLGFEFFIEAERIDPDCLFPETYFYCEYNYAKRNNYNFLVFD